MKYILILSAFLAANLTSSAQNKLLIYGGPQFSSAFYSVNGKEQTVHSRPGFHAGAALKVPFENHLYFSPTIFYSLKGYKVDITEPSIPPERTATRNETRIHTMEIGAILQYDFSMTPGHFFFKAGPTIDVQLAGKEKITWDDKSVITRKMKYSFKDYGYVGANLYGQLGYESKSGFLLGAMYSHGLGSINNVDYGARILHQVAGLSFGKYINR